MNWMARWLLYRCASDLGNMLLQGLEPAQRNKLARAMDILDVESTIETFTFVACDEDGLMVGTDGSTSTGMRCR